FAHQPRRPRLPGRADPQLHPGFDHGLYHRPRHVFRHGPGADRADAAARGIGRPLADDARLTAMLFGFQWDTQNGELAFAISILPMLLVGLWVTIQATIAGFFVALVLGLVFAVLRQVPYKIVSYPTALFIEFIRDTPLLVQLFFLYYV